MKPESEQAAYSAFKQMTSGNRDFRLEFESFGVTFRIEAAREVWIAKVRERLELVFGELIEFRTQEQPTIELVLAASEDGSVSVTDREADTIGAFSPADLSEGVESLVRIRVGDFAEKHVFIHAGVVAIGGKALVLPGRSRSGKSTLVAALLKHGATYLSDEYAIVDVDGLVHPFPKPLSIRETEDGNAQTDVFPEDLGAAICKDPIVCGLVLLSEFKEGSEFEPKVISRASGLLEILGHTVPIRRNTEFSLKVLNKLTLRAIIAQSYRPEAEEVAIQLTKYFNREVISTS